VVVTNRIVKRADALAVGDNLKLLGAGAARVIGVYSQRPEWGYRMVVSLAGNQYFFLVPDEPVLVLEENDD
jgi:hypothetical protein